jgi:hypothetical protein
MRRAAPVAFAAALALGATMLTAPAGAQALRVAGVEAPAACPGADAFYREVAARAPSVRRGGDGSPWTAHVRVALGPRGYEGRLDLAGPSGATSREASDPSCASVMTALAVMAALAITASPPSPLLAPSAEAPPASPPPAPPPPAPPPRSGAWRAGLQAALALESASAGAPAWGFSSGVRVQREVPSPVVFDVRVGFRYTGTDRLDAGLGGALVTLAAATLDVCILQLPARGPLRARLCPGLALGALRAEGRDVQAPQASSAPWASLPALVRLEWAPIRALEGLFASLAAGIEVPLTRHRFVWQPSAQVGLVVPPIGITGQCGVGVRFP